MNERAGEQPDAADEAGASDGASPLIWVFCGQARDSTVNEGPTNRPWGITGLAIFFGLGAGLSFLACLSLLTPGGPLAPMWDMNPRAQAALERMGPGGPTLMSLVTVACGFTAAGLWTGALWGYRAAMGLLVVNLLAEITNVVLGVERRAIVGVPIVAGLLAFLATNRVRSYFGARGDRET